MRHRWLSTVLARIRELTARRRVRFTIKALRELAALGLGLDEDDACDVLAALSRSDFVERLASGTTGEWLYVFKPTVAETVVYVKIILRDDCVVISFHEEEGERDENE